jgi:hypothetical protein
MKKFFVLALALAAMLSLVSCGDDSELTYFISFTITGLDGPAMYSWGDNAATYAYSSGEGQPLTLKAQDSNSAANNITITVPAATVGSHEYAPVTLNLKGTAYTGTVNVTLDTVGPPPAGKVIGSITAGSVSASGGSPFAITSGGAIHLERSAFE